jgi:hypothetical protein
LNSAINQPAAYNFFPSIYQYAGIRRPRLIRTMIQPVQLGMFSVQPLAAGCAADLPCTSADHVRSNQWGVPGLRFLNGFHF